MAKYVKFNQLESFKFEKQRKNKHNDSKWDDYYNQGFKATIHNSFHDAVMHGNNSWLNDIGLLHAEHYNHKQSNTDEDPSIDNLRKELELHTDIEFAIYEIHQVQENGVDYDLIPDRVNNTNPITRQANYTNINDRFRRLGKFIDRDEYHDHTDISHHNHHVCWKFGSYVIEVWRAHNHRHGHYC